jgi:hypothetical protein
MHQHMPWVKLACVWLLPSTLVASSRHPAAWRPHGLNIQLQRSAGRPAQQLSSCTVLALLHWQSAGLAAGQLHMAGCCHLVAQEAWCVC